MYNMITEAKDFASNGYSVRPAVNGGFVVLYGDDANGRLATIAAFSDEDDLLEWLTKGHKAAAKKKRAIAEAA